MTNPWGLAAIYRVRPAPNIRFSNPGFRSQKGDRWRFECRW